MTARTPHASGEAVALDPELPILFDRLNDQLGLMLGHAELLEEKAVDDATRARAQQVVTTALDIMGTVREILLCALPANS